MKGQIISILPVGTQRPVASWTENAWPKGLAYWVAPFILICFLSLMSIQGKAGPWSESGGLALSLALC